MKRSEMLASLSDKLLLISPVAITEEESMKLANEVLTLCEEKNMLPPFCQDIFQRNARTDIEPSGNEWEKEPLTRDNIKEAIVALDGKAARNKDNV
jgi:hypothetical protein